MSFIISTLQSCLPQSPYINLLQATLFISFTIYTIYDQYAKTFVRPIQRAQGIKTLREAMFVSLTIETEFTLAQARYDELAESIAMLEDGQDIFRMSHGAEILKEKKRMLEEREKELKMVLKNLADAMFKETQAVAKLMVVD